MIEIPCLKAFTTLHFISESPLIIRFCKMHLIAFANGKNTLLGCNVSSFYSQSIFQYGTILNFHLSLLMYHYFRYFTSFIALSIASMLKLDIVYFDMYQLCTHRHWPGGLVWIKTWKVDVSMSRLMVVFCTITSTKACVSYAN